MFWPEGFGMCRVVLRGFASPILSAVLTSALMVMLGGCDKRPQSEAGNAGDTSSGAATTEPVRQVSTAPQVDVPMKIMPLTLTLPAGWKLDPPLYPTFLEGPLQAGDVEISLTLMDSMGDRNRQLFIAGAIDESQKHPNRIHVQQLATKSGLATLERTTYLISPGDPEIQPGTTLPTQQLSWNIIVFVPYHDKVLPCSFDLLGLTQKEFEADQPAIRAIIDSAKSAKTAAFQ
jgi:hypothetical protein